MTVQEKINIALSGWVITKVGMVDRYRYLVIAQWDNDDERTPYIAKKDGKKYDHPTRMLSIDVKNNKLDWLTENDGYSHGYCDGGHIGENMEAFFISYNGITYHLDYKADTFAHEELLMTKARREKGISRGADGIRLIDGHFYSVEAGNEVWQRLAPRSWRCISEEAMEYAKKFGNADARAIAGYHRNDLYLCGHQSNLWHYDGQRWHKQEIPPGCFYAYLALSPEGEVYVGGLHGELLQGNAQKGWRQRIDRSEAAKQLATPVSDMVWYDNTLYCAAEGRLKRLEANRWVDADIEGIDAAAYLEAKEGIMLIATEKSLRVYNGKESVTLYTDEAQTQAQQTGELLLQITEDFIEASQRLLGDVEGE